MEEKLITFIDKNSLSFKGSGSDLNGNITVISGYADYIGASRIHVKNAIIKSDSILISFDVNEEINKVYKFATTYNYGKWWNSTIAKSMYKF